MNDVLLAPQKKTSYFLYWKLYVHNTLLACPIRATFISWSSKMLAQIWLLLALGIRATAYVASCVYIYFAIMYVSLELYNMCICDNHFDNNSTALLNPKLKANV